MPVLEMIEDSHPGAESYLTRREESERWISSPDPKISSVSIPVVLASLQTLFHPLFLEENLHISDT